MKKKLFLIMSIIVTILIATLVIGCPDNSKDNDDNGGKITLPNQIVDLTQWDEELKGIIASMSIPEKVGQTSQVTYQTLRYSNNGPALVWSDLLGSMILNAGFYPPEGNNPSAWINMLNTYQRAAISTRLKIPLIFGIDAVHGHNALTEATIFPHNSGLGAIAVGDLKQGLEAATTVGRITAQEMLATGINWNFSPQITPAHDVRWGRAYESFGENAEMVAAMGKAFILALQSNGVAASAKHFGPEGWNQFGLNGGWGHAGNASTPITTAQLEDAILPYRAAIEAGVMTIMPAKSYINGVYIHRSSWLLTDILRTELGFEGFVISDWIDSATGNDIIQFFNAGTDMLMYGSQLDYRPLMTAMENAVRNGTITMERLDEAVLRILRVKKALGLLEPGYRSPTEAGRIGTSENRAEARRIAAKAFTLMKNEPVGRTNALDVLKNANRILITGQSANNMGMQCGGWTQGWQGGTNITTVGTTIVTGIRNMIGEGRVTLSNAGNNASATNVITGTYDAIIAVIGDGPHAEDDGDRGRSNNATIPLRVGGGSSYSAAGNWNDVGMLNAIYNYRTTGDGANVPLIVVMLSGRPMSISANAANNIPHIDQWDAFIVGWLPGSETGDALADLLFGEKDFIGRTPYTWRTSFATVPGFHNAGTYPATSQVIYAYGHGLRKDETPCI
jgi:beta-glucosidase